MRLLARARAASRRLHRLLRAPHRANSMNLARPRREIRIAVRHPVPALLSSRLSSCGQPAGLAQAKKEVCVLDRLTRRPFHEIVDCRDDDQRRLPKIVRARYADADDISSNHVSERRRFRRYLDERLSLVTLFP